MKSLTKHQSFEDKSLNVENANLISYEDEEDVIVINEKVKVTEYAPDAFAYLRNLDQISNDVIKESLSPEKNIDSVFKARES